MSHVGRLCDHAVLVTGGATGIGRALVERFLAEGASVAVLQRPGERADELRRSLPPVLVVEGDVRSAADQRRAAGAALDAFGSLDAAVANAGIWDFNTALDGYGGDEALQVTYEEVFDVNVRGALLTAAACREALVASRGSLVFTASSSSSYAGGGGPVYVASKHAVHGLVRQLAFELAPEVRVNAVGAGATATPLRGPARLGLSETRLDGLEGFEATAARQIPLGFVSRAEDHAGLYVMLVSRGEARFVTGALIPSDGGLEVRGGGRRRPPTVEAAR